MELMFRWKDSISADRFPMWQAFPVSEYYQPVRLPVGHCISLLCRLVPCYPPSAETYRISLVPKKPIDDMPKVRTPGASVCSRHIEQPVSAFPVERKGRLLHNTFYFGANVPIIRPAAFLSTLRRACYQFPTQDSVHDCWLSFIMVPISKHLCFLNFARRNPHQTVRAVFPHTAF